MAGVYCFLSRRYGFLLAISATQGHASIASLLLEYRAEDHAPWLSDFVISLGIDLRTRLIGRSSGKEKFRLNIKGDILSTKRAWELVRKH